MATQLQRALGYGSGKEPVPVKTKKPEDKKRPEKKDGEKGDPYPNLPRRPLGIDQS